MERAQLSALQARQGTEASYEAYVAWEMASNAVLQNPSDGALAAQEEAARVALEKACADVDAQARLSTLPRAWRHGLSTGTKKTCSSPQQNCLQAQPSSWSVQHCCPISNRC